MRSVAVAAITSALVSLGGLGLIVSRDDPAYTILRDTRGRCVYGWGVESPTTALDCQVGAPMWRQDVNSWYTLQEGPPKVWAIAPIPFNNLVQEDVEAQNAGDVVYSTGGTTVTSVTLTHVAANKVILVSYGFELQAGGSDADVVVQLKALSSPATWAIGISSLVSSQNTPLELGGQKVVANSGYSHSGTILVKVQSATASTVSLGLVFYATNTVTNPGLATILRAQTLY